MLADLKRSWRAAELARLCCLSERHFFRGFKKETGLSPIDWLRRERIRLAQLRLLDPSKRIKEICDEVGYHDVFSFPAISSATRILHPQITDANTCANAFLRRTAVREMDMWRSNNRRI
jgi:AraC-like DNA-binding protein